MIPLIGSEDVDYDAYAIPPVICPRCAGNRIWHGRDLWTGKRCPNDPTSTATVKGQR